MKLIVGLGNPGKKYDQTRHNIGFRIVDAFSKENHVTLTKKTKFKGEIGQTVIGNEQVILLKPLTYMNLSGESVLSVKDYYNIKVDDVLVIYDDLDLLTGKIRFRQKGSAGGHNGIKSIINCINSQMFHRLKIGIDRDEKIPVTNYVLGKFTKAQKPYIEEAVDLSIRAINDWLKEDILFAMNKYN